MGDASDLLKAIGTQSSSFCELDDVVLRREVRNGSGGLVPAGTEGTIVGVWNEGEGFEVEFGEPYLGVVTVGAEVLSRISTMP